MTQAEIVNKIAREQRVEKIATNITRCVPLSPDLKDLCQMIYVTLLTCEESKIIDLWEHRQENFFLARIINNQLRAWGKGSPYYRQIKAFRERSEDLTGKDFIDDE